MARAIGSPLHERPAFAGLPTFDVRWTADGFEKVAFERDRHRLGVGDHALAVEAAEDHRDLLDAPDEVAVEALRVLVGHLDLAHAAALSASDSDPPVRLAEFVPRHPD